eukprot:1289154-Prymnesium_polylepis.1
MRVRPRLDPDDTPRPPARTVGVACISDSGSARPKAELARTLQVDGVHVKVNPGVAGAKCVVAGAGPGAGRGSHIRPDCRALLEPVNASRRLYIWP